MKQKLTLFSLCFFLYTLHFISLWLISLGLTLITAPTVLGLDWAQLQNNPQRTGYSTEKIDTPISNTWVKAFNPEKLHPQTQPVIASDRVFIGTEMGTFYAFSATDGSQIWKYPVSGTVGPILYTAGAENGKVFFGSMDGCVYALNVADGSLAWKFDSGLPTGFSSAVLLTEGKVFIANRGGVYFALDQANGSIVWQQDIGEPILMSSCYNKSKIYFGAQNMKMYALNSIDGSITWESNPLPGQAFKEYWPVAYSSYVFVRPMRHQDGHYTDTFLALSTGPLPSSELTKQDTVIQYFTNNPLKRSFFVLDENTGNEAMIVAQWVVNCLNGTHNPTCIDGDGLLIVPCKMYLDWQGGWGRLDLSKRKIVELLWDGVMQTGYPDGGGNPDENMSVSAAGRLVFTSHMQEGNAFYTGWYHIDRREWTRISPYHANNYFFNNTQGGGSNPMSISNGRIFHNTCNSLNCRTARVLP